MHHGSIKLAGVETEKEESNVHANRLEERVVVTWEEYDEEYFIFGKAFWYLRWRRVGVLLSLIHI